MDEQPTTPAKSPTPKKHRLPKPVLPPGTIEIAKLRSLQKSALSALDLDAAEDFDKQITAISADAFAAAVEQIRRRMCGNVSSLINEHFDHLERLRTTEAAKLLDLRRHVNTEFGLLKAKHLQELVDLEGDFAASRLKESQRLIPEYEELIEQSKSAAAIHDYDQARQLQTAAAAIAQVEMDKRTGKLDFSMKGQVETLIQTQQKEIELLVHKLQTGTSQIKGQTLRGLDAENEIKDAKLVGALNKAAKELGVIAPLGVDAVPIIRDYENDVVILLSEAKLALPPKLKWNAKTATRGVAKSPRKASK
jgi:hypothetical protein